MKLKIQVPERLGQICKSALYITKNILGYLAEYASLAFLLSMVMLASVKAPEWHNHWLRAKVGSKVYMIRNYIGGGGGTGFAVKAPSGQSYIMTNDHVCNISKDGSLLITDESGNSIRRTIVAHDDNSDLCLIEGMPGVEGLTVASDAPRNGDILNVVGHPELLPLALSKGEMIGKHDMVIALGPINVTDPTTGDVKQVDPSQGGILPEQCSMTKNRQMDTEMNVLFFVVKVKMCAIAIHDAYVTNVQILPGNSGSPLVNYWGQLQGVAFASDSETHWGRMISLDDLKAFISNY